MSSDTECDSDFYGSAETITELERRARLTEEKACQNPSSKDKHGQMSIGQKEAQVLCNPFAGAPYAWQLGETIDNFVHRLRPSTTYADEHTPWIYICNPRAPRKKRTDAESQIIPGCSDEGPEAEGDVQLALFVEGAKERLGILDNFLVGLSRMGASHAATFHDAGIARQAAARDVLGLAGHLGVTCGKWMLFIRPERVDSAWEAVARATLLGELGIAAKVLPMNPPAGAQRESKPDRLICIYTVDFRDMADVGRVLRRLAALGYVRRRGARDIYYKCDAYTYLGIGTVNPWGLRASLYSSSDIFALMGE